jgi:hypothetical protein
MKRYDLETAKAAIRKTAADTMENAKLFIEREANTAIDRLDAEAETIDTLGSPLELYEKSTVVLVQTLDLRAWRGVEFYNLRFETSQPHLDIRQGSPAPLAAKKYRALFFLIPVEE